VIIGCILMSGCRSRQTDVTPRIEFSKVPLLDEGGTGKIAVIEGRVTGARPGQQIVLYARSGAWYVQPFTDKPFTKIQPDSTWRNSTHLGTEYAALLVEPEYLPPARVDVLPDNSASIVAVAIARGEVRMLLPVFWQTWWFLLSGALSFLLALLAFHHLRLRQLTRSLNARFEERLAERTRITQEIHDTLLQGFLSASMQLDVAIDQVSEDSPAKSRLKHVQQLMGQVIEEGRNTVRGMRYSGNDSLDLGPAFDRVRQEFAVQKQIDFRVVARGRPRPLHPIIRDEVYSIGREALVNAFRHAGANNIEVEMKYTARRLRILVRDDGCGIGTQAPRSGGGGRKGLSGMRERAEGIGARLKVRSRAGAGTEVELSVPSRVAYLNQSPMRPPRWLARFSLRRVVTRTRKSETEEDR
jgi:signal transduction histidine kinase